MDTVCNGEMMMDLSISYREAAPTDTSYIRDILELDLGYDVPLDELADRVNEMCSCADYKIFVACDGEKTVGFIGTVSFIAFEVKEKVAKITAFAVSKPYRNRGIGTNLLKLVEDHCKSRGMQIILLNSGLARISAHQFYASKGYAKKSYGFVKKLL